MSETLVPPPSPGSPALLAFLRGIERRAWVFAQVQCGDEAVALRVVDATLREFVADARGEAIARWPLRFWTRLLGQPELLQARADARSPLSALTVGPRAALLLRLVAGLDLAHAAEVLGVGEPAYRFALERALADWARIDPAPGAVERLRDALLRRVKTLGAAEVQALALRREQALAPPAATAAVPGHVDARPSSVTDARRPRWRMWAIAALGLLAVAFVATFFWPLGTRLAPGVSEALPAAAPTGAVDYTDSLVVTHPDYAVIAAPADDAAVRDLALLSWIAAGSPGPGAMTTAKDLLESELDESVHPDMDAEGQP